MNAKSVACVLTIVVLTEVKSNGQAFNDPFVTPGQPAYVQPSGSFIYFTDPAGNRLGRVTPGAGSVDYFPVPTADSRPKGLTADSGGNVWFVEQAGNNLVKFDPTNSNPTEFAVPTPNSRPTDLLADPR